MDIGETIRQYRKQRGLTQKQLAKEIGLTASTITKYENNTLEPSFETMMKICEVLNIDIVDMVNVTKDLTVAAPKHFYNAWVNDDKEVFHISELLKQLNYDIWFVSDPSGKLIYVDIKIPNNDKSLKIPYDCFKSLCNSSLSIIELFFNSHFKEHE